MTAVPSGLLTIDEAAAWLHISIRTLAKLPIRRIKIGRCTRYDPRDLQNYADFHGTVPQLTRTA